MFFYVIQGLGETRLFAAAATQWIGSVAAGRLLVGGGLLAIWRIAVVRLARCAVDAAHRRRRGRPGQRCCRRALHRWRAVDSG